MTVKWVQRDPLVMNGEPFCYGSRLTVRQLLELRSNGYDLTRILDGPPGAARVGIAAAFTYAADHRERYADFFEPDGSLVGPATPRRRRTACRRSTGVPGIVVKTARRVRRLVTGAATRAVYAPGAYDPEYHHDYDRHSRPTAATARRRRPPAEPALRPRAPSDRARDPRRPARGRRPRDRDERRRARAHQADHPRPRLDRDQDDPHDARSARTPDR